MKYLITILILLLLPFQVMATRLENIIETGSNNSDAKPNRAFLDGLYLEFHGRKATDGEMNRFKDMSVWDTSNIVAGKEILKRKKVEKILDRMIYNNEINITGTPSDSQRGIINDYSSRYKARTPINVSVSDRIPDEFIARARQDEKESFKTNRDIVEGLYNWDYDKIFVKNKNDNNVFGQVFLHEFGHSLDDDYNFRSQKDLFNALSFDNSSVNNNLEKKKKENVAEMFSFYAQNEERFKKDFPKEYDFFEKTLKIPDKFITQ